MPLVPFTHTQLEVPVADRVTAATTFKQLACWLKMEAAQDPDTREAVVLIYVRVQLYATLPDGSLGPKLTGKGLTTYDVMLRADNNTAVHAQTGEILHIRTGETPDEWAALLAGDSNPLLLQGDFFEALLYTQPVQIAPMIEQFIRQADQPPFSKFS